jgi:glycosyltransferase involved in cell wall biosynthesis
MEAHVTGPTPEISVVIPVFNEEKNLEPLLQELLPVLERLGRPFEVLCVDDCSTDRSLELLRSLRQRYPWLRVLRHQVNSGESAAEATGFAQARGAIVVTMDADLQNDPADIPRLLDMLTPETAAVCGIRRKREDDWVKRLSSRLANRFRNAITGDRIADAGCTFRALRRAALREVLVFNGLHRFLPTILRLQGYGVRECLVNHRPRVSGVSKYGVGNRLWRGILDCLVMRWYRRRCVAGTRFAGEL